MLEKKRHVQDLLEYRVAHKLEHRLDILGVDRDGEMGEYVMFRFVLLQEEVFYERFPVLLAQPALLQC